MSNKDLQMIFRLSALHVLILVLGSLCGKAQYYPQIDTLEVLPNAPTVGDSVSIWTELTIPSYGPKIHDSVSISGDTIHIYSCLSKGFSPAFFTYSDTFKLGVLTAGTYYVSLKGYFIWQIGGACNSGDSTSRIKSFQVIDDIRLEEIKLSDAIRLELYPNPVSNQQQVGIYTQIPVPLQINLHSVSGQKVLEVFSGPSVQGQQTFEVDLSQLPNGVYFYYISIGEEIRHLKVIKQ